MNNFENFVHLKVKSHYSILEGSLKISDVVSEALKSHMPAVAITDQSNVFGAMEFTKACLEKGIQPIIGCSLLIDISKLDKNTEFSKYEMELTVLVKDNLGWRNLSSLISKTYMNLKKTGSKHVSVDELCYHNSGLICLFSKLNENALKNKPNDKTYFSLVQKLKNSFKDRLYIDLFRDQSNNMKIKEDYLLDLSDKFDIPLCCTNDVSFLDPSIYDAHDCLNCISQNTTVENPNRKKLIRRHTLKVLVQ